MHVVAGVVKRDIAATGQRQSAGGHIAARAIGHIAAALQGDRIQVGGIGAHGDQCPVEGDVTAVNSDRAGDRSGSQADIGGIPRLADGQAGKRAGDGNAGQIERATKAGTGRFDR